MPRKSNYNPREYLINRVAQSTFIAIVEEFMTIEEYRAVVKLVEEKVKNWENREEK
jgi:hypothetical protein